MLDENQPRRGSGVAIEMAQSGLRGSEGTVAGSAADALPRLGITIAVAIAAYGAFWPAETFDMKESLYPWLEHIEAKGPVGAFAQPFSNYPPAYLYLLAVASPFLIFGDDLDRRRRDHHRPGLIGSGEDAPRDHQPHVDAFLLRLLVQTICVERLVEPADQRAAGEA
jgi:hypothetical protein